MAGRKRSRPKGMAPLFDVEAFAASDDGAKAAGKRTATSRSVTKATANAPRPVNYWVRGRFRSGGGEQTHTVRAVGMSDRLDADVTRFVRYLTDEGWLFAAGRATLVEVLGVGADDGVQIALSSGQE